MVRPTRSDQLSNRSPLPNAGWTVALACLGVAMTAPAAAQEPVTLAASVTSPTGRSYVSAVAEMFDGQLVVVDMLERAVLIYSPQLDGIGSIARVGQGPREFLIPKGLARAPDGRMFVQDVGNGRMLELDARGVPTGDVVTSERIPAGRAFSGGEEVPVIDERGRWYFGGEGIRTEASGGVFIDSIALERWSVDAGLERVAARPIDRVAVGGVRPLSGAEAPFAKPRSDWAVCPDGTVYIGLPEPYRVRVVTASGASRVGPVVEFTPVAVTEE